MSSFKIGEKFGEIKEKGKEMLNEAREHLSDVSKRKDAGSTAESNVSQEKSSPATSSTLSQDAAEEEEDEE